MSDDWNIACSYGAHEWVRAGTGTAREGSRIFLKECANCDASYFCGESEWHRLPERAS